MLLVLLENIYFVSQIKNLISFASANCLYLIFLFFHLCLFSCLFSFGQGEHEEEPPTDLNTFGDDTSLADKSTCGLVRNRGVKRHLNFNSENEDSTKKKLHESRNITESVAVTKMNNCVCTCCNTGGLRRNSCVIFRENIYDMANVNIAVLFKNRFKHKKYKELICKKCHAKIAEIVTYKQPGDNNIPQDGLPCVTHPHTAIHNDQNTPSEPSNLETGENAADMNNQITANEQSRLQSATNSMNVNPTQLSPTDQQISLQSDQQSLAQCGYTCTCC